MRPSIISSSLVLLTAFASTVTSLEALVNSPCAVQCGNDLGGTSAADIVCPDSDYASTSAGQTFTTCITCQLNSTYQDPVTNTTDLQWGLYNIRYAMSYCLWGFPNNTNVGDNPCITAFACGPFEDSIELDSLATNVTEYAYCDGIPGSINIPKCTNCLQNINGEYYLSNFFTALVAGCEQQPIPGKTISIQGSVFSNTAVNITTPTATPSGSYKPSTGLSLGAKVGIAVGVLALLLFSLGFCIIWQGKRRRRAFLRKVQEESGFDDWRKSHSLSPDLAAQADPVATHATPPMRSNPYFDSPDSQAPLHPWSARPGQEESPVSAFGEKVYFSPYTSQYSSPVSAQDQIPPIGKDWTVRKSDLHGPTSMDRDWTVDRKGSVASGSGKGREKSEKPTDGGEFEMQNVAPILNHPWHGRGPSGESAALTEEDARRGAAL